MVAAFMFLLFQVMKLIRLFSDAVKHKAEAGVVPEGFTLAAVAGALAMIGISAWLFLILYRQKRELCLIRSGNRFLLLGSLLLVYGVVRAIRQTVLYFQNFEFLFLVDILAFIGGLIAPSVILYMADRNRIPPGDVLLLFIGVGTTGFAILGFIMVAISIGKDYNIMQALPELAFRAALMLCGFSAIRTALKLRADIPLTVPLPDEPMTEKPPKKQEKRSRGLRLPFLDLDELPGFDGEEPELLLFDDEEEETGPDEDAFEAAAPPSLPSDAPRFTILGDGRLRCPDCLMRFPANLGVCPRCGLAVEAYEEEFVESLPDPTPDFPPPQASAADLPEPPSAPEESPETPRFTILDDGRLLCLSCRMRFPANLGVCPRCGLTVPRYEAPPAESPPPATLVPVPRRLFPFKRIGIPAAVPPDVPPPEPEPEPDPELDSFCFIELEDGRLRCPQCRLRFPGHFTACPRCGLEIEA